MIQDVVIYFVTREVLGDEILIRSDRSRECLDMVQAVMHVYAATVGKDLFFFRMKKGGPYSAEIEARIIKSILPQIFSLEGLTISQREFTELGKARIRLVKTYLRYDEACGVDKVQFYSLLSSMLFEQKKKFSRQNCLQNMLACMGCANEFLYDFIDQYQDRVETFFEGTRNLLRHYAMKRTY